MTKPNVDLDPERVPVIVGVGQINDRPEDPEDGLDSLGLMAAALHVADDDAGGVRRGGGPGWLDSIDSLAVVFQISWPQEDDMAVALAERLEVAPAHCFTTPTASGDGPIRLLNEAANRIGEGVSKICAVVGAEALRSAAYFTRKAAAEGRASDYKSIAEVAASRATPLRRRYGLLAPIDVYPLYENATRAAWGQTLAQAQAETGEIWSRFAEVAAGNDGAWIRRGATAEEIVTPGPDNRPLAHPYTKLMVANSSVNQGAGFIVTSLAEARRRGVAEDRLVYVGRGAAAMETLDPLERDRYDRSTSMTLSLTRALDLNGIDADGAAAALDHVELYSCFPCVPKMARRVIGWPEDRPATVFGGLTFGGGPIGNYMSHAVVEMTERLRGGRDADAAGEAGATAALSPGMGLLFANGGIATKNHAIVLSNAPIASAAFPQEFDVQAEAEAVRDPVPPLAETAPGPARLETWTVFYDRKGAPRHGVVVAISDEGGARTLARVPAEDAATLAFLTDGAAEPVGSRGVIEPGPDGDQIWRRAG
ncbi:MAG: acetyl-CoA acetyltransferase [Rhodobacteraceae bacterium]|nr:acetyl-CoA acetyltransferase [Paracoccaceae bacterium]